MKVIVVGFRTKMERKLYEFGLVNVIMVLDLVQSGRGAASDRVWIQASASPLRLFGPFARLSTSLRSISSFPHSFLRFRSTCAGLSSHAFGRSGSCDVVREYERATEHPRVVPRKLSARLPFGGRGRRARDERRVSSGGNRTCGPGLRASPWCKASDRV